jgi:hypothetical protein
LTINSSFKVRSNNKSKFVLKLMQNISLRRSKLTTLSKK